MDVSWSETVEQRPLFPCGLTSLSHCVGRGCIIQPQQHGGALSTHRPCKSTRLCQPLSVSPPRSVLVFIFTLNSLRSSETSTATSRRARRGKCTPFSAFDSKGAETCVGEKNTGGEPRGLATLRRQTLLMSRGSNMIVLQLCCFDLEDKKKNWWSSRKKIWRPRLEGGAEPLGLVTLS